jgi:hypothetical protein
MWRRVAGYKYTDVSNKRTASIFKVWNFPQMDVVLSSKTYPRLWHSKFHRQKHGNFCVHLCEDLIFLTKKNVGSSHA